MVDGIGRNERREQLVHAAFARVAAVGFAGLRLRQIATEVGIDHSTLYYYLPTKADVIRSVAQYATDQLRPTMPDIADAAAALRGHIEAVCRLFEQQPELAVVTAELDLLARRDAQVGALMRGHENGWRSALRELLDSGKRQGHWPGIDHEATVELLIASIKGSRHVPHQADQILDQLVNLLIFTDPAGSARGVMTDS